jgi:hypothetical protein
MFTVALSAAVLAPLAPTCAQSGVRLNAALSYALLVDADADGRSDVGDMLRYTAWITNTSAVTATRSVGRRGHVLAGRGRTRRRRSRTRTRLS